MSKITLLLILGALIAGAGGGYWVFQAQNPNFKSLNSQEMRERILQERDYAISQAVKAGVYRCCIDPPCTMCYLEANEWNNFTAGTCACDDLIAQGKEPCPQCKRGLCATTAEGVCKTKESNLN